MVATLNAELAKIIEVENERNLAYMGKRAHSRNCCAGWKIYQPDGTTIRSFKEALDGSTLCLEFIYGPDNGPMISEVWEKEYYVKCNGKWFSVTEETFLDNNL